MMMMKKMKKKNQHEPATTNQNYTRKYGLNHSRLLFTLSTGWRGSRMSSFLTSFAGISVASGCIPGAGSDSLVAAALWAASRLRLSSFAFCSHKQARERESVCVYDVFVPVCECVYVVCVCVRARARVCVTR